MHVCAKPLAAGHACHALRTEGVAALVLNVLVLLRSVGLGNACLRQASDSQTWLPRSRTDRVDVLFCCCVSVRGSAMRVCVKPLPDMLAAQ